jgi:hypothetical protein
MIGFTRDVKSTWAPRNSKDPARKQTEGRSGPWMQEWVHRGIRLPLARPLSQHGW